MDDVSLGVFNDIEHCLFKFLVRVRITLLHSVFTCVCNGLDGFSLDLVKYLGHMGLDHFGNFVSRHDIGTDQPGGDVIRVP